MQFICNYVTNFQFNVYSTDSILFTLEYWFCPFTSNRVSRSEQITHGMSLESDLRLDCCDPSCESAASHPVSPVQVMSSRLVLLLVNFSPTKSLPSSLPHFSLLCHITTHHQYPSALNFSVHSPTPTLWKSSLQKPSSLTCH